MPMAEFYPPRVKGGHHLSSLLLLAFSQAEKSKHVIKPLTHLLMPIFSSLNKYSFSVSVLGQNK